MSADGSVELTFAGDLRRFRLDIAGLIALQDKRNSGPLEIAYRLQLGTWRLEDIQDTIRIGLIGAGVEGKIAQRLVDVNVQPGHITEHVLTAQAILLAALQGVPDEPVGKAGATTGAPGMEVSPPPPSMEMVQSSDSRRKK